METQMIFKSKKRFTAVIAALTTIFVAFFGVASAHAAPNISWINPEAETTLVIHKFEQPDKLGEIATGLAQNTQGLVPVEGAEFQATLVPGINVTTNAGWDEAASMSPAEAKAILGSATAEDKATSNANGELTLNLSVGLYYVEETKVPAGVVATDPFLVIMPIPHPTSDEWLYTVHIYPKNPRVLIELDVYDETAIKLGDTVTWTSKSTIPNNGVTDAYVVQNLINPNLKLTDRAEDIKVNLSGNCTETECPELISGEDYETKIIQLEGRETIVVTFTQSGREKISGLRQKDPNAKVQIEYNTVVLKEGIHENEARVLPDKRAVDGLTEPVTDTNLTKWGPISIKVHEKGVPSHLIPDSKFKLYLTPEDAKAGRNPITVNGVSEWETDENGMITIHGLRFSNFANGLDHDKTDPLFRYYYAMPISYPPGWIGDKIPLQGAVTSVDEPEVLIAVVWKEKTTPPAPKPPIPQTGGQVETAFLIGALLMLGGTGAIIIGRRKRATKK